MVLCRSRGDDGYLMSQETDKLLKLRTTQYNVLKVRGIDLLFIMKIFDKYEKKQPVSEMEAEQYNRAMKILRKENCADVFLNKYYKMDEEDLKVLREKFKDTIREYQQKDGKDAQTGPAAPTSESGKEKQSGFGMQSEAGEPKKSKPPEKPGPGKKSAQKPKKKKSEWDGYGSDPKKQKKVMLIVLGIFLVAVVLYMALGESESDKKKREMAAKRAQQQQVQKPPAPKH